MTKTSPTQRTLAMLRKSCSHVAIVEKWIPQTCQRKDVWGFGDILAIDGLPGSLLVQCTSGNNVSARVHKIRDECREAAEAWLRAGNRIVVIGFRKLKPRGTKVAKWHPRIVDVTLDLLAGIELDPESPADSGVADPESPRQRKPRRLTRKAGDSPTQDALPGHPEQLGDRAARVTVPRQEPTEDNCPSW